MGFFSGIWDRLCGWFRSDNVVPVRPGVITGVYLRGLYPGVVVRMAERNYSLVSVDWLLGGYYNYFLKVLGGLKISGWSKKFDCDSYSNLYYSLVGACHRVSEVSVTDGIAVGVVWYRVDGGGGHAINTAVVEGARS